jgi:hypothetical protein
MKATIVFEIEYPASATTELAKGVIAARDVLKQRFPRVRIVKAIDEASTAHDTIKQLKIAVTARLPVEEDGRVRE